MSPTTQRFNDHAPIRPTVDPETNAPLSYRTMPLLKIQKPRVMLAPYQICQMRLYRALKRCEIPNGVPAIDLRQFIDASHTVLGYTILQAVLYEPRRVVNNRYVEKATVVYTFRHMKDFEYGLEWQICTWLRHFLKERDAPEAPPSGPSEMEEALNLIADVDEETFDEEYVSVLMIPKIQLFFMDINERTRWNKLCEGLREPCAQPVEKKERKPLVSVFDR